MKFKNAKVLITGGASGIGKIMGRMALEKGADCLIIWDINITNIELTRKELGKFGKVMGYVVDVSRNEMVVETYEKVKAECGYVDILINCAGIVTSNKTFDKQTVYEIYRTMNINTIAPMLIARAMLPDMLKRNRGHICTIASAGGMISNPKMSVYAASKWGVIGWSDSVRIELQEMNSEVHITTVAPYYINTGMFDGVKSRIIPILKPEYVSKRIMRVMGNIRLKRKPALRLPSKALETIPVRYGPLKQPRSPARARRPNMGTPPLGKRFVAIL